MAKSKVNHKIETKEMFSIEGFLNIDKLPENAIIFEVEEEGEISAKKYLDRFNGELIKLAIVKKEEEFPED